MFNIPGGPSEARAKEQSQRSAEEQSVMKENHTRIKTALTEAFGRQLQDSDVSISRVQPRGFRVFIPATVLPPKPKFSMFGFELPTFRRRPMGSEIDAALVNVGTAAKRRFFLRLFPEKRGAQYVSHVLRDEEALSRLGAECYQRLGNQAQAEPEAKAKGEAQAKVKEATEKTAKVEAQAKTGATPPSLGGIPGISAGVPGIAPGGVAGSSPFAGLGTAPRTTVGTPEPPSAVPPASGALS